MTAEQLRTPPTSPPRSWRRWIAPGTRHLFVYGTALVLLFPFFWVLSTAFKPASEIIQYPPTLLPQDWSISNFTEFFSATRFHRAMINSAWVAVVTTVFAISVAAPAAYSLSRFGNRPFKWAGRMFIYGYMIPPILLLVPVYRIVFNLRLANNPLALIPIYTAIVMPLSLWTLRSFFAGIPMELEEAAMVDGATRFQAFRRVVLPQAWPGIIATGIIAFNVGWSEFLFASTLLTSQDTMTISPRLESFMGRGLLNPGWLMAGAAAVTVPLIILAGFAQRYLVEGAGAGAVKG